MKTSKNKKRPKSTSPRKVVGAAWSAAYRARNFNLADARLAVDIAAIQDHITDLFARLSHDARDKAKAVDAHLIEAHNGLVGALKAALAVEKS